MDEPIALSHMMRTVGFDECLMAFRRGIPEDQQQQADDLLIWFARWCLLRGSLLFRLRPTLVKFLRTGKETLKEKALRPNEFWSTCAYEWLSRHEAFDIAGAAMHEGKYDAGEAAADANDKTDAAQLERQKAGELEEKAQQACFLALLTNGIPQGDITDELLCGMGAEQ